MNSRNGPYEKISLLIRPAEDGGADFWLKKYKFDGEGGCTFEFGKIEWVDQPDNKLPRDKKTFCLTKDDLELFKEDLSFLPPGGK